jgi:ABC-2 type transport system ATP-binding protein
MMQKIHGFPDKSSSLECRDISFSYGKKVALSGVNITLTLGVTGLLGRNGAGKSTFMEILATVKKPCNGSVIIDGTPVVGIKGISQARQRLGYLPQKFDLMLSSSCLRNVAYSAWCRGMNGSDAVDAAQWALGIVGLDQRSEDRAGKLSGGQRQRLGIACALVHRPSILLLDEPTVGLDPVQRREVRSYLAAIAQTTCVLISTHIIEDLTEPGTSIAVVRQGRIVYHGIHDYASDGMTLREVEEIYFSYADDPNSHGVKGRN